EIQRSPGCAQQSGEAGPRQCRNPKLSWVDSDSKRFAQRGRDRISQSDRAGPELRQRQLQSRRVLPHAKDARAPTGTLALRKSHPGRTAAKSGPRKNVRPEQGAGNRPVIAAEPGEQMLRQASHELTIATRGRGLYEFTDEVSAWVSKNKF